MTTRWDDMQAEERHQKEHIRTLAKLNEGNRTTGSEFDKSKFDAMEQFIKNGIEFGYIKMPSKIDPAYKLIRSIIG